DVAAVIAIEGGAATDLCGAERDVHAEHELVDRDRAAAVAVANARARGADRARRGGSSARGRRWRRYRRSASETERPLDVRDRVAAALRRTIVEVVARFAQVSRR